MDGLTVTQRIRMIKTYYKNGGSETATYRALRGDYGLHNRPTSQAITNIERPVHQLKISLLKVKVLPKTGICRFLVVLRN